MISMQIHRLMNAALVYNTSFVRFILSEKYLSKDTDFMLYE